MKNAAKLFGVVLSGAISAGTLGISPILANAQTADPAGKIRMLSSVTDGKWIQQNGRWWFRYPDGTWPAAEWKKIDGFYYHFDDAGWMQTGWFKENNTWYFLRSSGAMAASTWLKIDNVWYYFGSSGAMKTGWHKENNTWYYLSNSGAMKTGWAKINDTWYFFDDSGAMVTDTAVDGYILGEDGAMIEEKDTDSGTDTGTNTGSQSAWTADAIQAYNAGIASLNPDGAVYILNMNSMKIHTNPGCSACKKMSEANKAYSKASLAALESCHFETCKTCFK